MKASTAAIGRRLPPVLLATLVVMWLLLSQTWSLAQLALGVAVATALVYTSAILRPVQPRLRRLDCVVSLAALVLVDIVRSNYDVARIVLGLQGKRVVHSGFVTIPLELRDPHGLAVLAAIVTSTPGTVWVSYDTASLTLMLHVLDLRSDQEWIDWIKQRYERRLREIFE
jgi:multicomponent K+:H+ antiporter subunit E